ncbi:MAG: hypothetical protein ABI068_07735 [Ktedonobacterales bacterium]
MPRRPRKGKDTAPQQHLLRLDTLSHNLNLIIEGGIRPLGLFIREQGRTVQPRMAIWLDADSGMVRSSSLITPDEADEDGILGALEALQMALARPEPLNEMLATVQGAPDLVVDAVPSEPQAADEDDEELSELERHRRAKQARQAQQSGQGQQTPASYSGRQRPAEPQAALPALVRVNDEQLAEAVRALLEPLEVVVEYEADLPNFEEAYAALSQSLGADPDPNATPPEPFAWEVDNALLPSLYKAAADLWRRGPWEYLPDMPPIAVELGAHGPQDDTPTLYATTLGGAGEIIGVVLHFSTEAVENTLKHGEEMLEREESVDVSDEQLDEVIAMLRQSGLPVDMLPAEQMRALARDALAAGLTDSDELDEENPLTLTEDALAVFYESPDEIDPTYLEWLDAHAIKYSTRTNVPAFYRMTKGIGSRPPSTRETQAFILAVDALNQFYSSQQSRIKDLDTLVAQEPIITHQATVTLGGPTGAGKGAKTGAKTGAGAGAKGAAAEAGAKDGQTPSGQSLRVRVTYPAPGYTFARFFSAQTDEDDEEDSDEENLPLTFPFALGVADLSDDLSDENGDDGVGDEE